MRMANNTKREKISSEERLKAVEAFLAKENTLRQLGEKYGVHHSSIEKWVNAYQIFGNDGLRRASNNNKYSEELKKEAVKAYLTTDCTLKEVCNRYKIRRMSVLQSWLLKYNDANKEENTVYASVRVLGNKTNNDANKEEKAAVS